MDVNVLFSQRHRVSGSRKKLATLYGIADRSSLVGRSFLVGGVLVLLIHRAKQCFQIEKTTDGHCHREAEKYQQNDDQQPGPKRDPGFHGADFKFVICPARAGEFGQANGRPINL